VVGEVTAEQGTGKASVGIDLGCKETATDSNGDKIKGREYRTADTPLKYSHKLVNENTAIFVGNVNSKAMVKTKMAKSVLDSGWGILKKCWNISSITQA
jgi:transposase